MTKTKRICYTGIGSRKNGNHSEKQFLAIMNNHFHRDCPVYFKSLKCKECKKSIEMNSKEAKKQLDAHLQKKPYKMSKKREKQLVKQINKCNRCKNKTTRKCSITDYLEFSGAELGKC